MKTETTTQHWILVIGTLILLGSIALVWNASRAQADEATATPLTLAASTVNVTISVDAPVKCKINEEAPNNVTLVAKDKATGKTVPVTSVSAAAVPADAKVKTTYQKTVSLSLQNAQTIVLTTTGELYTCDKTGKVCYPPITLSSTTDLKGDAGTTKATVSISLSTALPK